MSNRTCVNCGHNKRIPMRTYIECRCDLDNHYIGYVECFVHWCRHWKRDRKFDELEQKEAKK